MKIKNVLTDPDKIHSVSLKLKLLSSKNINRLRNAMTVLLGSSLRLLLATGENGFIYYWKDSD